MIGDILQPSHLLFILVVALLVLGPKRLPEVGRALGRGLRDFRSALNTDELRDHMSMMSTTSTYTPPPTSQESVNYVQPSFATEPESSDPWGAQPEASEPSTTEPESSDPRGPQPGASEPSTSESATAEQAAPEPPTAVQAPPEPPTAAQITPEPPTVVQPPPEQPAAEQASPEPATVEQASPDPAGTAPSAERAT